MCGIVGYVGSKDACSFLVEDLRRLEYCGYDSSGLAVHNGETLGIIRSVGRIESLVGRLRATPAEATLGIGHTCWDTHGPATEPNAHPHLRGNGEIALVHNGVIENFQSLKDELSEKGYQCQSETDSEVIAHLLAENLKHTAEVTGQPNVCYLGRQFNFPTALDGALQLKEISYIHAEGYPAAEMKHGPIALVDDATPSVFIIPHGATYDKVITNMEDVKARGGRSSPLRVTMTHKWKGLQMM